MYCKLYGVCAMGAPRELVTLAAPSSRDRSNVNLMKHPKLRAKIRSSRKVF